MRRRSCILRSARFINKIGDYKSAVNHLSYVVENENSDESTYLYPTPELREYAKTLRKIEREPAEAPQTSAAVRALERARRNRGKTLLEESRKLYDATEQAKREQVAERKYKKLDDSSERVSARVYEKHHRRR